MSMRFFSAAFFLPALLSAAVVAGCRDNPADADPCRTQVLVGGLEDNFAPENDEHADPSPSLMNYMLANYYNDALQHQFDQIRNDRPVGHTFRLDGVDADHPASVTKAIFTMRIRTITPAFANDWLHLMVDDGNGVVRAIYDSSVKALYGGSVEPGVTKDVIIDLGRLGLLDELRNGVLHIYLQDDTKVDFVKLEVEYCVSGCDDV